MLCSKVMHYIETRVRFGMHTKTAWLKFKVHGANRELAMLCLLGISMYLHNTKHLAGCNLLVLVLLMTDTESLAWGEGNFRCRLCHSFSRSVLEELLATSPDCGRTWQSEEAGPWLALRWEAFNLVVNPDQSRFISTIPNIFISDYAVVISSIQGLE